MRDLEVIFQEIELLFDMQLNYYISEIDSVAEWLRRETRNLMGFSRAGSNPAAVVKFFLIYIFT